jgi:hypothetical protein
MFPLLVNTNTTDGQIRVMRELTPSVTLPPTILGYHRWFRFPWYYQWSWKYLWCCLCHNAIYQRSQSHLFCHQLVVIMNWYHSQMNTDDIIDHTSMLKWAGGARGHSAPYICMHACCNDFAVANATLQFPPPSPSSARHHLLSPPLLSLFFDSWSLRSCQR